MHTVFKNKSIGSKFTSARVYHLLTLECTAGFWWQRLWSVCPTTRQLIVLVRSVWYVIKYISVLIMHIIVSAWPLFYLRRGAEWKYHKIFKKIPQNKLNTDFSGGRIGKVLAGFERLIKRNWSASVLVPRKLHTYIVNPLVHTRQSPGVGTPTPPSHVTWTLPWDNKGAQQWAPLRHVSLCLVSSPSARGIGYLLLLLLLLIKQCSRAVLEFLRMYWKRTIRFTCNGVVVSVQTIERYFGKVLESEKIIIISLSTRHRVSYTLFLFLARSRRSLGTTINHQ